MSAQILLFPAQRIRRLTCPGSVPAEMLIISMADNIPSVEHNSSVDLLYAIFHNDRSEKQVNSK